MLQQAREHRRHAARLGAAVARQGLEEAARLEIGQDHHRAAGVQQRLDRAGHGVLVVERHRGQRPGRRIARPVFLDRTDPPQLAGMGQHDALGAPGRARGVGQERHVLAARVGPIELLGLRHERRLVRLPARWRGIEGEARRDPGLLDHVDDERVAVGLDHRGAAAGILDDVGERIAAELDVERHRHDAGAHRAIHHLDELEPVVDRHRHAIARLEARVHDQVGEPVQPLLELAVGDLRSTRPAEIDHRDALGVAGDRLAAPVAEIVARGRSSRSLRSSAGNYRVAHAPAANRPRFTPITWRVTSDGPPLESAQGPGVGICGGGMEDDEQTARLADQPAQGDPVWRCRRHRRRGRAADHDPRGAAAPIPRRCCSSPRSRIPRRRRSTTASTRTSPPRPGSRW